VLYPLRALSEYFGREEDRSEEGVHILVQVVSQAIQMTIRQEGAKERGQEAGELKRQVPHTFTFYTV
jgi:hypothetical protein